MVAALVTVLLMGGLIWLSLPALTDSPHDFVFKTISVGDRHYLVIDATDTVSSFDAVMIEVRRKGDVMEIAEKTWLVGGILNIGPETGFPIALRLHMQPGEACTLKLRRSSGLQTLGTLRCGANGPVFEEAQR